MTKMTTDPITPNSPRTWEEIRVGHTVLAKDEDCWFEALVIAVSGDVLTLQWRDYPDEPELDEHRTEVALLYSR